MRWSNHPRSLVDCIFTSPRGRTLYSIFLKMSDPSLICSCQLRVWQYFSGNIVPCPRGLQKSDFKNVVYGLKPFSFILTTMFEPKNLNTSTLRTQKLSMSKGTFLLDIWNIAILLSKMMFLHDPKFEFHIISQTCHQLWNGLYY